MDKTLDTSREYGTVHGADDGTAFVQDALYFDRKGQLMPGQQQPLVNDAVSPAHFPTKETADRRTGRPSAYNSSMPAALIVYFQRTPQAGVEQSRQHRDAAETAGRAEHPAEIPTLAGFARSIGVHRDTVHGWTRKHPDFSDALRRASERSPRKG